MSQITKESLEKLRVSKQQIPRAYELARGYDLAFIEISGPLLKACESLERITGMVETWTDEHGQRKTEEIYASKIARETLAEIKKDLGIE